MHEHLGSSLWNSFLPHGQSYFWNPLILWAQSLSNLLIALACWSLPLVLLYNFRGSRQELKLRPAFLLFSMFAFALGATFLFNIVVTWIPVYQYQSILQSATAAISILVVLFLPRVLPKVLKLPSEELLEETNQELEVANDKYNLLLAGSRIGVFEWQDPKSWKKPMFWSGRMFELFGFKANSFDPTTEFFLSLVHPEDRHLMQESLNLISQKQLPSPIECRIRVLDVYRWFRVRNVGKFDDQGLPVFVIGAIEDIHDQKMAEESARSMNATLEEEIEKRTLQLELANRAKTRFLANMSHEMRTPLGLVLGFTELLQDNQSLDSEAREYVSLIGKNGEILSRVINDLLDLSKIEAGRLRFQFSKVQLKNLIDDFKKAFSEEAAEKGIQLSFQNLCSDAETVVTDEIRLKQIVYNLLSNAIKFTDLGRVHFTIGKSERTYYVDVVDTGIGIPEPEKSHIFEEFARGEMAEAGERPGTGLGLRLAQNLAQALGGNVELVSSQVGKGSHFRFTFKSDEQRLQRQIERRQEAAMASKLNDFEVFVLDDNEDNIRLAEVFLKKLGCRVRGFTSARSLFAEMVSAQPDLILLDINMPEMNGFEVFDRLRQSGYKKPIWALTAYSLNEDIQAILDHGFDDYIRKPISVDSMKRKLTFELRERSHD